MKSRPIFFNPRIWAAVAAVLVLKFSGPAYAASIGANFLNNNSGGAQSSPSPLAAGDEAGAPGYEQSHWNNLGRWGQTVALPDDTGADTGVTLTWDSNNAWNNGAATTTPNGRLMYGYLDSTGQANWTPENPYQFWWNENKPNVFAAGLAGWMNSFEVTSYTVVVYTDGSGSDGRIAEYWLQAVNDLNDPPAEVGADLNPRVFVNDSANFTDTFTQVPLTADSIGAAAPGNFIVFTNLSSDRLVLRSEEHSSPSQLRAAINAVQFIPNIEKPFIRTAPQAPGNVYVGETLHLSVVALGPELAYQWRLDGEALTGANASALAKPNLTIADSGDYDVVITNSFGSVTSAPVSITVLAEQPVSGAVVTPATLSRRAGGTATFSVTAAGTTPFAYQWHKDGAPLADQTNAVLALTGLAVGDTGDYTCGVTNFLGGALSTVGHLTVTLPAGTAVGLNFQDDLGIGATAPAFGLDTAEWANLPLGAAGVENVGALTVSWSAKNTWRQGPALPAGEGEVTFGYLDDGSPGSVVTITGLTTLFGAYVVETVGATDHGIALLPVNLTNGTQTLTYSAERFPAGELTGVSSLSAPLFDDAIQLRGTIGDSGGARGGLAGIIITDKPVITVSPQGPATIYNGAPFSITGLNAAGVPVLTYQWRRDGQELTGATNAVYFQSAASAADLGDYDVVVGNSFGSVTSSIVSITSVLDRPELTIEAAGTDLVVNWPFGTLLEANAVTGPWTTNTAAPPYQFTPTEAQKYFRLLLP